MEIYLANLKQGIREEEIASIFSGLNRKISVKIVQTEDNHAYAVVNIPRKRNGFFKAFSNTLKC